MLGRSRCNISPDDGGSLETLKSPLCRTAIAPAVFSRTACYQTIRCNTAYAGVLAGGGTRTRRAEGGRWCLQVGRMPISGGEDERPGQD